MTLYAADEDGACVCVDCIHGGCVRSSMPCEAEHCQCDCNRDESGALLCDGDPAGNPYPHTCAAGGVMNCTACAYQPHVRARAGRGQKISSPQEVDDEVAAHEHGPSKTHRVTHTL